MNTHATIDHGHPTVDFAPLDGVTNHAALAEALLEVVGEMLVVDLALVVFHRPHGGRPMVFGGRFDDRRRVGRTLRMRANDADRGIAAVGSVLGPSVRVVRIGEAPDYQGMFVVGSAHRGLRGDEIELVRDLAETASKNLRRLALSGPTADDDLGGTS
ncbi:MAG TPA: hypothetical protein VJ925_02835 [Longimicrobiales bacterium]|nr:hypothetical protein [Longimicrobiales bacterium]